MLPPAVLGDVLRLHCLTAVGTELNLAPVSYKFELAVMQTRQQLHPAFYDDEAEG